MAVEATQANLNRHKPRSASNIDSMLHSCCPVFLIVTRRVAAKEHRWNWRGDNDPWAKDIDIDIFGSDTGHKALKPGIVFSPKTGWRPRESMSLACALQA
eukprot:COSAG02_NODE_1123_length_14441_cov_28.984521_8_plen_100_part_00